MNVFLLHLVKSTLIEFLVIKHKLVVIRGLTPVIISVQAKYLANRVLMDAFLALLKMNAIGVRKAFLRKEVIVMIR